MTDSNEIQADVERFLQSGGQIKRLDPTATAHRETGKRRTRAEQIEFQRTLLAHDRQLKADKLSAQKRGNA